MSLPPSEIEPPSHSELVGDLQTWRTAGVRKLRTLSLQSLSQAALAQGVARTSLEAAEPSILIDVARRAIATKSGSVTGRCALVLLGLDPNTFDLAPHLLREDAAEIYGVTVERFRRDPQFTVLSTVADGILEQCFIHRARLAQLAMEQRHPADSRLALQWLERFEGYFRVWTPFYALGADLTAYRATLLDTDRTWDEPGASENDRYIQETQAAGHGTFAFFHAARVLAATEQLVARFGGLWILSTPQAEVEARDALTDMVRLSDLNERDQSWMRWSLESAGGEMHPFLQLLESDAVGVATLSEWQVWLDTCECTWVADAHDPGAEYFPTARHHKTIDPACRVHQSIEAANRFCTTIEQEWLKVADWYGIDGERQTNDPDR